MKSMIIALLPGLEEETGEYFEKVRVKAIYQTTPISICLGPESPRPTLRDRLTVVFLPKHMVGHADNAICSRNLSKFLVPSASSPECQRR
jgi:hypothetical protein